MGAFAVIWSPVRVLREVAGERNLLAGFLIVALNAALGLGGVAILLFGGNLQAQLEASGAQLPEGFFESFAVIALVFTVLVPFAWWLLVSLVMQLVTRFFGGEGPLSSMFAVVGTAFAPLVLSAVVTIPLGLLQAVLETGSAAGTAIGLLSNLFTLAFLVWHVVLIVIGAALARNIGYGESTGSCAISCGGCLGVIILVIVTLAVIGALFAGVLQQ
ncbi:MAG: YIP1 family protein [Rubrobacteraceae bacterium]